MYIIRIENCNLQYTFQFTFLRDILYITSQILFWAFAAQPFISQMSTTAVVCGLPVLDASYLSQFKPT